MSTGKEIFSQQANELVSKRGAQLDRSAQHLIGLKDIQERVAVSGKDPIVALALDQQYRDGSSRLIEQKRALVHFPQQLQELLQAHQLEGIVLAASVQEQTVIVAAPPPARSTRKPEALITIDGELGLEGSAIPLGQPFVVLEGIDEIPVVIPEIEEEGGLVVPWRIDETGRVFPRPEVIESGRRPFTDLARKQEGIAYAQLSLSHDTPGYVYRTFQNMTADVYQDVIETADTDEERKRKLSSNTGAALQAGQKAAEKIGQVTADTDLTTAPHLARLLKWAMTFPEYAILPQNLLVRTFAQVINREITYDELKILGTIPHIPGTPQLVIQETAEGAVSIESESKEFTLHPAERYFLASLLEDDRSHEAARQAIGIEGDEISALPPRDREQLNDIIARVSEHNHAPITTTYEDFITGIAAKLTFYQEHKAQVVAALEGKDPDLLFILSFFPTQQRIPLADLFHQMAAAVLPNTVKKNDSLGLGEPGGILSSDFAKEIVASALNTEGSIPDFAWVGQRNLASRGFEILDIEGVPTLMYPTLESMKEAAYAFLHRRFADRGRALEGREKAEEYFIQDIQAVAELLVRGRHVSGSQRPKGLRSFLHHIERTLIFTDLPDDVLVDILYRKEQGLQALRNRGVTVNSSPELIEITRVASGVLTIPNQDISLNPAQLDLKPWEIYAITSLLDQIGTENLRQLGLHIKDDTSERIKKARRSSESSKGQLRNPDAVRQIFTKLILIAEKGPMAPFIHRPAQLETLVDIFDGVSVETIKNVLTHELQISFPVNTKD